MEKHLGTSKEPLNKSSAAEQRIFFLSRAVPKVGNTYSIPPLLEPSAEEKISRCQLLPIYSELP